ncbi:hypothetical protein Q4519_07330 [Motilimonas sp. 1_MG-2023]|uniref:DUF6942 family protein n=1 Tax=Motilimonas sp. 1_MG-2023 TaxID=3062672 RepID=UPI0026E3E799|nr:hypothetical protein [Motilimonas sp. 1_MG-2023]MDO6525493.1 hypothetical protein [Motilimonas sp. 1_MG-2023]
MKNVGFGCSNFSLAVYIENKPAMVAYENLDVIKPLSTGEIQHIGLECGNGWRKVFNVYTKLLYALDLDWFKFACAAPSWQAYRDQHLLQQGSATALLFSPPVINHDSQALHIISGKTYANKLLLAGKINSGLIWLDEQFAIDVKSRLIVCPYFDYRQLSNEKIDRVADYLIQLVKTK